MPSFPTPWWPEAEPFLQGLDNRGRPVKKELFAGAIQVGKTFHTALAIFSYHPWAKLVWWVAPRFEDAMHGLKYLSAWFAATGNLASANMPPGGGQWKIATRDGMEIKTQSAQNPENLAGESPDIVVMDEAGRCSYDAYLICRSRVVPKGGRLILCGTFEGADSWYAHLYKRWMAPNGDSAQAYRLPAWVNRVYYPGGRQDEKILDFEREFAASRPDVWKARFVGEPASPPGVVFSEFDPEIHVVHCVLGPEPESPDPFTVYLPADSPVELWVDPGYDANRYYVGAVVQSGEHWYTIDEVAERQLQTDQIIDLCRGRPWWKNVTLVRADVASRQHHGNESAAEAWKRCSGLSVFAERVLPEIGADRVHWALRPHPLDGLPRWRIDPKCKRLAWELSEGYRRKMGSDGEPLNIFDDRHNDGCKAHGYGFVQRLGKYDFGMKALGPSVDYGQKHLPWRNLRAV